MNKNFKFDNELFSITYKLLLSFLVLALSVLPVYLVVRYNHFVEQDEFLIFNSLRNGISISLWNRLLSANSNFLSKLPPLFGTLSEIPTEYEIKHLLLIYRVAIFISISYFFFSFFFLTFQINKSFLHLSRINFIVIFSSFTFLFMNLIDRYSILFFDISIITMYTNVMSSQLVLIAFLLCLLSKPSIRNYIFVSIFVLMTTNGIVHMVLYTGAILFAFIIMKYCKNREIDWFVLSLLLFCIFFVVYEYFSTNEVAVKQDVYAYGVSDVHSFDRFIVYLNSSFEVIEIVFLKSIDKSRIVLTVCLSMIIGFILYLRKIQISILYFIYVVLFHFFFCFSIFWGGMADVTNKTSSLVIMYVFVAINLLFFYSYLVLLTISKITSTLNEQNRDVFLDCLKKIVNQFFYNKCWKKVLIYISPFIIFIYIGLFCVGIPTRTVIKDYIKGTAQKYDVEVMDIYRQFCNSESAEEVIMEISNKPWSIGYFGLFTYDNYRSNTDYSKLPKGEWLIKYGQTMDTSVAPFFGKKHIEVIPREKEE